MTKTRLSKIEKEKYMKNPNKCPRCGSMVQHLGTVYDRSGCVKGYHLECVDFENCGARFCETIGVIDVRGI